MKLYECIFCGDVFDRTDLNDLREAGEEFWIDGNDFVCPDCLDNISRLSLDDQFSKLMGSVGDVQDSGLPAGYAEIEYDDFDDPEAIDGARWDDMNYRHYTER